MGLKVQKIIRILALGLIIVAPLLDAPLALAASATMSLSPGSSSIAQGSTLTVSIYENSGDEPVNAVQANLSYPADLLDFVSISSSPAFSIGAQNSGGGGGVQIARGALPAVTGNQVVAYVRFKAKTSSGSAAVGFAGGSSVISANSNSNILAGTSGANYSLKPPAPTPTPAAADTIPPKITAVAATNITYNSATITWTTSEPASSEVDYGINASYGLSAVDNNMVTDHKVVLNSPLISPAVQYHFVVKSVDPSGNAASSVDSTFTTKGATLAATVVNQNNKPVSGAKVSFNDKSATTDKKGKATIADLPLGKQTGTITYHGKQTVVKAEFKSIDPKGTPQAVTFKIQTHNNYLWIILLPLLALLVYLLMRNNKQGPGGPKDMINSLMGKLRLRPHGPEPAPPQQPATTYQPIVVDPGAPDSSDPKRP